jgi:hypothetical protein
VDLGAVRLEELKPTLESLYAASGLPMEWQLSLSRAGSRVLVMIRWEVDDENEMPVEDTLSLAMGDMENDGTVRFGPGISDEDKAGWENKFHKFSEAMRQLSGLAGWEMGSAGIATIREGWDPPEAYGVTWYLDPGP